jgi:hypothetical protein
MDRQSIHFLNVEILQVEIVITFPIYLQVQQVYLDYFFLCRCSMETTTEIQL